MDEQAKPSEHVRLELQILGDTIEEPPPPSVRSGGPIHQVLVVASDPLLRLQLQDCLRDIPGVQVLVGIGDGRPDLIVHDAESSVEVSVTVASFDVLSLAQKVIELLRPDR